MRYFYYRILMAFSKIPTNDAPARNAMLFLSCVICTNIITILVFLNHFTRINLLYIKVNGLIIFGIVLSISLFITNYFLLYKKRFTISERFRNETIRAKIISTISLSIYLIFSFMLVYIISKIFPVI